MTSSEIVIHGLALFGFVIVCSVGVLILAAAYVGRHLEGIE